jgi:molybdate transport system substrate-binding protein
MRVYAKCLILAVALWASNSWASGQVRLAVASNFLDVARNLGQQFTQETGIEVRISAASTGKLYAQIRNGLPVDIFMAADQQRPELLIEEGLADGATQWTYALGELVLWVPGQQLASEQCLQWFLGQSTAQHQGKVAMANPRTAPYGAAAQSVMQAMQLQKSLEKRLILGENIAQAYLFADSGAAIAAWVARSQWLKQQNKGCAWQPAADDYAELRQDAVVLNPAIDKPEVVQFVDWMQSPAVAQRIQQAGYRAQ